MSRGANIVQGIVLAAFALGVAGVAWLIVAGRMNHGEVNPPGLTVGEQTPEIVLQDLDGKEVKLSDLRGNVVVLDIWATWCPPCVAMIPHEREMAERLKDKPFRLVSISADEDKQTVKNFVAQENMPWSQWWNGPVGGIVERWGVEYFPTIYVLDSRGVVRYRDLRGEELEEAVNVLLNELEAKRGR